MQLLHSILSLALLLGSSTATKYAAQELYRFPPGSWLENIAVRPCGSILVTMLIPNASLYEINPFAHTKRPSVKLVHTFPNSTGVVGIAETTPDTFYVATSNISLANLDGPPPLNKIWRVAYPGPKIELVSEVKSAKLINGLAALNARTILAADSSAGTVIAIDTASGSYRTVIADPLMAPVPALGTVGVNGIKVRGNELYFTNTALSLLARIPIHADGTPAGKVVNDSSSADVPPAGKAQYDDFILDRTGRLAFAATGGGNAVQRIDLDNGETDIVAGNVNQTTLAEPTAVAFGRTAADAGVLYVTTAGGVRIPVYVDGKPTPPGGIGGQLVALSTRGWAPFGAVP